jgi:hypothetical protein
MHARTRTRTSTSKHTCAYLGSSAPISCHVTGRAPSLAAHCVALKARYLQHTQITRARSHTRTRPRTCRLQRKQARRLASRRAWRRATTRASWVRRPVDRNATRTTAHLTPHNTRHAHQSRRELSAALAKHRPQRRECKLCIHHAITRACTCDASYRHAPAKQLVLILH